MNEDDLLRDLARLADADERLTAERFDERWDALAAGRLSAEEEAALRAEVAGDPELELALEGFRPLSRELRAAIVSDAASRLAAGQKAPAPARVPGFPRRVARKTWLSGLAVAASLLLAVALWRFPGAQTPLPAYELSWAGGLATQRSGSEVPAEVLRLAPGIRFEILLSPHTAVGGQVVARCFVERAGSIEPWPWLDEHLMIADSGVVSIFAVFAGDLEPGVFRLLIAIGRPGTLPEAERLRQPRPGLQIREIPIEVVAAQGL